MQDYKSNAKWFSQIFDLLESHFGKDVEFVIHDLSLEYEHTLVDIRNGNITNRKIGDTGDILGLQVIRGSIQDGNCYNYINFTEDGRTLRSSTLFLKDENMKPVIGIGINEDITAMLNFESYLVEKNRVGSHNTEIFVHDVNKMLDKIIDDAQIEIGKSVSTMNKDDKIKFVSYLDQRGAFLITKSGPKVCELLGISKYTLYNYLETVRE